jgi:type IV pilus assembly protein PilA
MQRERGFTIIELMIVVTIVGIMSAIAIPSYQGYVTRAKISEGLTMSQPVKTAIADYFSLNGSFPPDNATLGLDAPALIRGQYVQSVEVRADGVILVTFGDVALAGQTIRLTPTATDKAVQWTCATTLPSYLKPKECA